jgi:DNA mismatch repair ATPase MutS
MYELDAYFSVAKTSRQHSLTYPTLKQSDEQFINIKGLRHIFINNPITNNIHLCSTKNVSFITGVNMAGKSTFLKAVGINVYLSHLGFPVPAQEMTISIFDGLMTTVNIKDDLNAGYSHFYTEVKRVKEVADKINEAKRIVVIFDELFRGTNLKDAHEASVSIINAFTKIKMCLFLISTHITEVADDLKHNQNVDFNYFGTKMINNSPVFSRQLKSGINYDRLGLWIIQQENILQILNENADR